MDHLDPLGARRAARRARTRSAGSRRPRPRRGGLGPPSASLFQSTISVPRLRRPQHVDDPVHQQAATARSRRGEREPKGSSVRTRRAAAMRSRRSRPGDALDHGAQVDDVRRQRGDPAASTSAAISSSRGTAGRRSRARSIRSWTIEPRWRAVTPARGGAPLKSRPAPDECRAEVEAVPAAPVRLEAGRAQGLTGSARGAGNMPS